ncbi:MAG: hypothetical protein VB071_01630 [Lawsonibacter sp.]|nr:hypothetical protein [Lawsonibacter sp.]
MNHSVSNNNPTNLKALAYSASNGTPVSLLSDSNGTLLVKNINTNDEVQSLPYTAFHELRVATLTPVAGWTFNYNVNTDLVKTTVTVSGTVTQSNSKAVLQTGTAGSSSAAIQTIYALRYTPGVGGLVRFTALFTAGVAGNTQVIGIGDDTDGFFFGYDGTSFGVLRRQNGTNNWIPQTTWNKDKFDGSGLSGVTLDPTKGNVYSIRYQWLGFGAIDFMIENPTTGEAVIVNRIAYANSNTNPSIYNPTLPVYAKVENTTNTTNITLQTPSAMAFIEGSPNSADNVRNSIFGSKTTVTTEAAILTIRNKSLFQTKTNRVRVRLDFLSTSADGTKNVTFRLLKNATLTGGTYVDISTNTSVVDYNTGATYTAATGKALASFECGKTESLQFLLDSLNLVLAPGDTLTVTATSIASVDVFASLSWGELF